jgi:hypothetical protein
MKNLSMLSIIVTVLITGFLMTGCDKEKKGGNIELCPPEKINVNVTGRAMTIIWNSVDNAQGYEIVTTSVGCSSGNRTINTQTGTTAVTSSGSNAGNVKIGQGNSISITLMASSGNANVPMASAVTAKIKSLGGTVSGKEYVTSDYSEVISHTIQK